MARIVQIFHATDMRNQHKGLTELLKGQDISEGSLVVFINKKRTIVKVLSGNNVIGHYKSRTPIDFSALSFIPEAFGAKGFSMSSAIRRALIQTLGKEKAARTRNYRREEPHVHV